MPLTLTIKVGDVTTDYTRFLSQDSVQITEGINVPTVMQMSLNPFGNFTVPPARAYVDLYSSKYGRSLFTGFIAAFPERVYLARAAVAQDQDGQLFRYDMTCTSDEHLLNIKAIPFVPAYINRTQGQILTDIAHLLCSGFYDTSMIASGDLVPFFEYSPHQSWSEVAKLFADGSRYRYKARNRKLVYQPYGDDFLGIEYNEATQTQGQFATKGLSTKVMQTPIVNDITIIGDTEAGNNHEDYFIGDGFTGNFPLKHKVFRGASSLLLQESWSNASLNMQQWFLQDPGDNFDFSAGALNLVTASGIETSLGQSYLAMQNGLELAGGIDLEHGEFNFNDICRGVIGGIYPDSLYASGVAGGQGATLALGAVLTQLANAYIAQGFSAPYVNGNQYDADQWRFFFDIIPGQMTEAQFESLFVGDALYTATAWAAIVIAAGFSPANVTLSWNYAELSSIIAAYLVDTPFGIGPPGVSGGVAGVRIQPYAAGLPIGTPTVTQPNHTYVLQTVVTAPKYTRYTRTYRTIDGEEFGGGYVQTNGSITFLIQDYDIFAATGFFYTPKVKKWTVNNLPLPPFAAYALVNNLQLNITDTYTTLATMPLGTLQAMEGPSGLQFPTGAILPMLPPGSGEYIGGVPPWASIASANILPPPLLLVTGSYPQLVMGNGFQLQDAQVKAGQSADDLAFYAQSLPAAGTPIRYQSWEAQAAVSRLQASASIAIEKAVVGDDGIRSAIVTDLNPLPRTSEDCDNAALAFLQDRTGVFYNGTYTCTTLFFNPASGNVEGFPVPGRFLHVNAPRRGLPNQKMLVTAVTMKLLDMKTDLIEFVISFGADLYLEKILKNFVDLVPPGVLVPSDKANPPDPRLTINAGNTFLPDLDQVQMPLTGIGPSGVQVLVDQVVAGSIEVRRRDTNWGRGVTPDLVTIIELSGSPSGFIFNLDRRQFDQLWYMRNVGGGRVSRRSKVLRVRWPQRPQHPLFVSVNGNLVQLNYNGDVRSIYGIELRTPPVQGAIPGSGQIVLYQRPATSYADLNIDIFNGTPLSSSGPIALTTALSGIVAASGQGDPAFVNGTAIADVWLFYYGLLGYPPLSSQEIGNIFFPDNAGPITVNSIVYGSGKNYVAGDTGFVNGGGGDATYRIFAAGSVDGDVLAADILNPGTDYQLGINVPTTPGGSQPGVGSGFEINIEQIAGGRSADPSLWPRYTLDQFVALMAQSEKAPNGDVVYAYFFNHQWIYSDPLILPLSGIIGGIPGQAPFTVLREQYAMLTINDTELTQDEGIGSLKQMNFFGPSIDDTDPGFYWGLGACPATGNVVNVGISANNPSRFPGRYIGVGDFGVWNDPPNYEIDQVTAISGNVVTLQRVNPAVFTPSGQAYFGSPKTAHTGGNFYRLEPKMFSEIIKPNAFGTAMPIQAGLPAKYEWAYANKTLVSLTSQAIGDAGVGPLYTLPLVPTGVATVPKCPGYRTLNGAAYHIGCAGALSVGQVADFRIKFQAWESLRTLYAYLGTAPADASAGSNDDLVTLAVVYITPDGATAGLLDVLGIKKDLLVSYASNDLPDGRQMPYHLAVNPVGSIDVAQWTATTASPYDYPPNIIPTLDGALDGNGKLQLGFTLNSTEPIFVVPDGSIDLIIMSVGADTPGSDLVLVTQT